MKCRLTPKVLCQTSPFFNRTLDARKIEAVIADAQTARQEALIALRRIVLYNSRPDFDKPDPVDDLVQTLGVLPDILPALSLIAAPTAHPRNHGHWLSPFSLSDRIVPVCCQPTVQHTRSAGPRREAPNRIIIHKYNITLRHRALELTAEVAKKELYPEARELIRLQPQTIKPQEAAAGLGEQGANWQKLTHARNEFREFYRGFILEESLHTEIEPEFIFGDFLLLNNRAMSFNLPIPRI